MMAFTTCVVHGTQGLARRQPHPWEWRTHGGAQTAANPLRGRPPSREAPQEPPFDGGSRHGLAPWRPPSFRKRPSSDSIFDLIRRGADDAKTPSKVRQEIPVAGEERTTVGPCVQAPFESPEDVHFLDRRVIRRSQVVHGERAQCELHDIGPVVPIGNHRQDVPSVRFGGRDDAHLQGVDLGPDKGARQLPASREETFQASFEVGMRTPGPVHGSTRRGRREHQRPFQVVVVGEVNSLSDAPRRRQGGGGRRVPVQGVLLLIALLPRRRQDDEDREQLLCVVGATRLALPNPVSQPPHVPPFDLQQKGSGEGGRTRATRARPRRAVRERRRWCREPRGTSLALLAQEPRDGGSP